MKEPLVTCFAFLIAINASSQFSYGSNYHDRIKTVTKKQPWENGEIRRSLERDSVRKEWRNKRDYQSRETQSIADWVAFGSNDRTREVQDSIHQEKNRDHIGENPLIKTPNLGTIDQKTGLRNLLHKKYIDGFSKVLQKRLKKPRQEIEFLEDSQDSEAKQVDYDSPHYEDITGNAQKGDDNGLSNSYITIIDNDDGKADTDSYSTLSSDVAKSEYTNVESSINEGANEETQMLGKEVNDVMGALTKSDSKIDQLVTGDKEPQVQNDVFSLKQTGVTDNDEVTILENGKEENNNTQSGLTAPPGDITVIEDQDEVNTSENTRPELSKTVWDAIKKVDKNFSNQDQNQHNLQTFQESQSGKAENRTQWPAYLPPPKNVPESYHVNHPLTDLESKLNMFAGPKTQPVDNDMKSKPEDVHTADKNKLFVKGEAEEGPESMPLNSQLNPSSPYLHQSGKENASKNRSYWYDQNGRLSNRSAGDNFIVFDSPGKALFQKGKAGGNKAHIQPLSFGPHIEHSGLVASDEQVGRAGQKTENFQRPGNEMSFHLTSNGSSKGHGSFTDINRETENNGRLNQNAHNTNEGQQDEKAVQSNRPHPPQTLFLLNGVSKGNSLFKVPIRINPNGVRIIYVKPVHQASQNKNQQADRTSSFQSDGYYRRPYASQAFQSQLHQYNANNNNGLQNSNSTFPWVQENRVDTPLNQELGRLAYTHNADIQTQYKNKKPGDGQATIIAGHQKTSPYGLHQQSKDLSETVHKGSHPLESWSAEYHKLIDKLRELYGRAHGDTSPDSTSINDAEQMMKEVSRFHAMFAGEKDKRKKTGKFGGDSRNTAIQKNFLTISHINKDVPGLVRSFPTSSNSSNLFDHVTTTKGAVHNNTENLESKASEQLATRQPNTDYVNTSNASETPVPNDGGQSSHEVLMTYFRNETVLRKQLHNKTDFRVNDSTVGEAAEIKGKEGQFNEITNGTTTETTAMQEKLSAGSEDATKNLANDSVLPWPSQVRNVSKEEEEGSLAKYIEDFIAMLGPNKTMEFDSLNETTGGSSNSSISKTYMDAVFPSDASKKENVTDTSNRVIIVVSPKSLKDLMRNRTHNSSLLAANKDHPMVADKAENSTEMTESNTTKIENNFQVNRTHNSSLLASNKDHTIAADKAKSSLEGMESNTNNMTNFQGNTESLPSKTTSETPVSKQQTLLNVAKDTSKNKTVASEGTDTDLTWFYREELKSLEISLSRDFMSTWIYYQKSFDEIGINPGLLRSGIANLGSPQRLMRVFRKALTGTDVNVLVVGGSISAGGGLEKDRGNVEGVYHKAFSHWWNNTVTPITTSELKINTVAIGGTDSEYFSYCIKNYMRSLPDIVIWELAANDYQRYNGRNFAPAKPLEQLTRIILSLPSRPALILANFFRGNYYRTAVGQDCPDSEDEGGMTIAQYYKLTSLSWRNVICSSLADQELDLKKLFSSDGYHPSILGHAQMSALLISYLKGVFEQTISQEMILSRNQTLQSWQQDETEKTLPKPIFDDPENPRPYCWTLLTPDYGKKLRNTLPDLEFTEATGFQFANISHWPIRRDRLRCLKAIQTGALLKMKFIVPSQEDSADVSHRSERELAITTHNSFGGMGTIWIDEDQQSAKIIKEQGGQRRTQNDVLTRTLAPGVHTVTVSALQPGFCLSAVAVL